MNENKLNNAVFIGVGTAALVFLLWWMTHDPVSSFAEHQPGADNRPEMASLTMDDD